MGLANRVVPAGQARAAAVALAKDIARFPAATTLSDRQSVYDAEHRSLDGALAREFAMGVPNLSSAKSGAKSFAEGKGRGGSFDA